jgi:hypothetical protein
MQVRRRLVKEVDPDDDPEKYRDDRHGHGRREFLGAIYARNNDICNL